MSSLVGLRRVKTMKHYDALRYVGHDAGYKVVRELLDKGPQVLQYWVHCGPHHVSHITFTSLWFTC